MTSPLGSKLDSYVKDTLLLVITETRCENCKALAYSSQIFTVYRPLSSDKLTGFREEIKYEALADWSLPRGTSTLRKSIPCCHLCFESYRINEVGLPPLEIDHSPSALARFNTSLKRLEREQHSARRPAQARKQQKESGVALSLDDFIKDA